MRILFLNPSGALGGAERALIDLVSGLRLVRPQWDLHLIASGDGLFVERAREVGVHSGVLSFPPALARTGDWADANAEFGDRILKVPRLCAASLAGFAYVSRLRATIRRVAPDVIHTNGFKMHIAGALAAPAGVSVIWHVRDYVSQRFLMARALPMLRTRCTVALTNSRSVADDVHGLCPDLEIVPAHDAIDLNEFSANGPAMDLDAAAGLPPAPAGTIRVGLLATMAPWKGQEVFLDAISRLAQGCPVRGYLVGGPLYETEGSQYSLEHLRAVARRHGIAQRVGFTGFVPEPSKAMRALDIVVHASTSPEPFGLVIAEAMACGKALITTACGGASELVTDGFDAVVVPPRDAQALADRITQLAGDANLRERLGANGRLSAEKSFAPQRLADQLVNLYERITTAAAAAA